MYRDHRKGSGGPPGGATPLGGPHGPRRAGHQPLEGWAPPPLGPMRLGLGGNPRGGAPFAWGASAPSLAAAPSRSHLEGPAPFPLLPINRGVRGGLQHHIQGAAPPLPNTSPPPRVLGEAPPENCHSTTITPSCCCWSLLPQPLPPPCWIKARETSPGCTCVERGGAVVRRLDRNQPRSESLRVRLPHPRSCNASASRSTRVCRFTPLPLVARLLHRLILVMRRKF